MSFHPHQEPERLHGRSLAGIAVVSLIVGAVATLVAVWLLRDAEADLAAGPPPEREITEPQIGIVDQTLIRAESGAELHFRPQREQLQRWGWVDREQGVAHVPVGVAVQLMLEEPNP